MTIENDIAAVQRVEVVPAILNIICRTTGMSFAAVARVTPGRWVACAVHDEMAFGLLPGGELEIENTLCNTVRRWGAPVVIDFVPTDPVYNTHPVPLAFGFASYISVPIILADGEFFGTLCALGRTAARLKNPEITGSLTMFAALIAMHLDGFARTEAAEARLAEQRAEAEERDRFIAILGHDLRNPVAAMMSGTRMLLAARDVDEAQRIATMMFSTLVRMGGLVENVLDFARAKMGAGVTIEARARDDIEPALRHVVDEMRAIEPHRKILVECDLRHPAVVDLPRVTQLFANLLGNALHHGSDLTPVRVEARSDADGFTLAVANAGPPIPEVVRARLFQPFSRGEIKPGQDGLGLGLYIASEIARAHGGTIDLATGATETRFTFRAPAPHPDQPPA